ncbi:50S ribosomal protein L7/L12 [Mycoplasmopsis synoviae]|uniref:Large ribosomal subunit protein bL12 n=1 Tax=Mycoplasmopsis synoviae (strain 53) TaxID=262723 RepID=RL7_MYCS5|nr:50S ribosomal protein L7/L12 [Mycoplasmopsis synoviae]Q4A5Y8.1 RecName: Full=Large ribosomal subunit protein bL12; AltName: Full=50S ribosomal protein L7/L12 [Mycoplasmopsis synoviae 53]AAZ43833.1 50S ribosomal protein L7/L12 [Mycoplasmopsis synoviae 53]UBX99013.1 50S ribosomal protein L7/L12 [Mycoplasmopsis synoviae]UBX99227.1 50S ribosomal protein L7/L12 [Mycoplasmopsis synoviae]UBY00167.1 50S ribosomal protein L7/L12 [Mycoplasmopsis synoviae]
MAKLTKETFVESLKEMSIKEVMELVEAMKEEFGVDPAAAVAVAAAPGEAAEAAKTSVKVVLKADNGKKVQIIKAVKDLLGGSLMDAKKIVDNLPAVVKENIKPEEAEPIRAALVEAGAEVSVE